MTASTKALVTPVTSCSPAKSQRALCPLVHQTRHATPAEYSHSTCLPKPFKIIHIKKDLSSPPLREVGSFIPCHREVKTHVEQWQSQDLNLCLLNPSPNPEFFLLTLPPKDPHALSNLGLWITQLLSPAIIIHAPGRSEHPRMPQGFPQHHTSAGHTAQGLGVGPERTQGQKPP